MPLQVDICSRCELGPCDECGRCCRVCECELVEDELGELQLGQDDSGTFLSNMEDEDRGYYWERFKR